MARYTIRSTRTSYHIDGLAVRTTGGGNEKDGVVSYYAENACSALTRSGHKMVTDESSDDLAEILRIARLTASAYNAKMCKNCEAAAEAIIAQEAEQVAEEVEQATEETAEEFEIGDHITIDIARADGTQRTITGAVTELANGYLGYRDDTDGIVRFAYTAPHPAQFGYTSTISKS